MIREQEKAQLDYKSFLGLPIDIAVYDPEGLSITAEHKEPVVVKTTVAYKGKRSIGEEEIGWEEISSSE